MAWITPADVEAVYQDAHPSVALCQHVQGLAEITIGQREEVSAGLKAVMVDMVRRFELASSTDTNLSQETIGGYSYSIRSQPGAGLTNHEKRRLRSAVGLGGFQIQPTTRGEVETPPRSISRLDDWLEDAYG